MIVSIKLDDCPKFKKRVNFFIVIVAFNVMKKIATFLIILVLLGFIPTTLISTAKDTAIIEDPFFSFAPVKIEPKIFLVEYDPYSLVDDLAYLSAIPSALYYSSNSLYASPLIFYEGKNEDIYLDANKGIGYFLDDWFSFAEISNVITINLNETDLQELRGIGIESIIRINGKDAEQIANNIALQTWNKSKYAVISNLPPEKGKWKKISGSVEGYLPKSELKTLDFNGRKEPTLIPTYHNFTVPEGYKWVDVWMDWGGFGGQDPDLQLYDWKLGEVAISENWNVVDGAFEQVGSYIRNPGEWGIGITYMPTEGLQIDSQEVSQKSFSLTCNYNLNVKLYPGKEFELTSVPLNCRNARITLEGPQNFGLVLRDENKAVIASQIPYKEPIKLDRLGQGKYYACVVSDGKEGEFKLTYEWEGKKGSGFSKSIEAICNSAIFASYHNCPLLFAKNGKINAETKNTLKELGVSTIYSTETIKASGYNFEKINFDEIRKISKGTDIVFSSSEPFSYTNKPIARADYSSPVKDRITLDGSYFFAPAAYAAAFHGSNLILVEDHFPQTAAWHSQNWLNTRNSREPPSVGDMIITGNEVYSYLKSQGLDKEGKERILTIAGEYQLGPTWDRMFVGKAIPGRIFGTPVDISYWFARNAFYPALIYANPALGSVALINGSSSHRTRNGQLVIDKEGGEEIYSYPVLNTWVCHNYRFNERASKYWGLSYSTTSGLTPYWSKTDDPIDKGVSRRGMYLADMTCSETIPKYLAKAGYSSCFSTNLRATAENLNRGALLWVEVMHGGHRNHGIVGFWSLNNEERNPWRSYEYRGSTKEPDTIAMSKLSGLDVNPGHDGVVICIWGQTPETTLVDGLLLDKYLDNIHSTGFMAGSCLIANTYFHLTLIRHGSVFQIIDPWVTSWYSSHAFNMIARSLALGQDIGSAYEEAIREVGISYLTEGWWWDICENIVYYGDPGLRTFAPRYSWEKPEIEFNGLHLI